MSRLSNLMLLTALPLALAACVVESEPPPATMPDTDACGASGYQGLVGQSAHVLRAMTLPERTRVIEPGMPVTMDYMAERLNIWITADRKIERVSCG